MSKAYTVKELSELAGTDKQTIYRYIKKNRIEAIQNDSEMNQRSNAKYYNEATKNAILKAFKDSEVIQNDSETIQKSNHETIQNDSETIQNDLIELLKSQVNDLKSEIDTKNTQIDNLINALNSTQQANNELLKNEQMLRNQINTIEMKRLEQPEPDKPKKAHWWDIFK